MRRAQVRIFNVYQGEGFMKKYLLGLALGLLIAAPAYAEDAPTEGLVELKPTISAPADVPAAITLPDPVSAPVPTTPILRAIVDSRTLKHEFLLRVEGKDPQKVEVNEVEYCYLLEGGKKVWLSEKFKKIKDARPAAQKHPKVTRFAIATRQKAKFYQPIASIGFSAGCFFLQLFGAR